MNGFFKTTDEYMEKLGDAILMTRLYWSRRYEYKFALKYVEANDVVLDAACGTYHPFKFALAERCKTYACDLEDAKINDKIIFTKCNVADMPYQDAMFDKVFCISALEHMKKEIVSAAAQEFMRVLKPEGTLIVTIDCPLMDPQKLLEILNDTGFTTGDSSFDTDNAITSLGGLHCYHIVAGKKR